MITGLSLLLLACRGLTSDKLFSLTSISKSSLAHLNLTGEWSAISSPRFKLFVPCVTLPVFVGRGLGMCKGFDNSLG